MDVPPEATPTITASAVATKRELPRPQPARQPMSSATLWLVPDRLANATMSARPISRVFLPPIREDTQPVTSIITAVTRK